MRIIDADKVRRELIRARAIIGTKYVDDAPTIKTKQIKYFDEEEKVWKTGEVIVDE